jgi:hypothetical protein
VRLLAVLESPWQSAETWKRVTSEQSQEEKRSSGDRFADVPPFFGGDELGKSGA